MNSRPVDFHGAYTMPILCRFDFFQWYTGYVPSSVLTATSIRTLLVSLIGVFLLVGQAAPGQADETSEVRSGILVEEAVLEPAKKGENARLHFKITNLSTENVILQKVRATVAKSVEVQMILDEEGYKRVESLHILREEILNLQSSHIRIEFIDLLEDLEPNSKIEFKLVFNKFETFAIADVHSGHDR
tara:strand:- start:2130 stop:2693 length:564 start_codon:yes stop_codon:yes gene_type:complete